MTQQEFGSQNKQGLRRHSSPDLLHADGTGMRRFWGSASGFAKVFLRETLGGGRGGGSPLKPAPVVEAGFPEALAKCLVEKAPDAPAQLHAVSLSTEKPHYFGPASGQALVKGWNS